MHKKEMVALLKKSLTNPPDRIPWPGREPLFLFLIDYFTKLEILSDVKWDFWDIMDYFPKLFVDAIEAFRLGSDDEVGQLRRQYEMFSGCEVPNLVNLGDTDFGERGVFSDNARRYFTDIFGESFDAPEFESYCDAQYTVIRRKFHDFAREIYRPAMWEMVDKSKCRGMSGMFGNTELRSYMMAGRIMITFARRIDKSKPGHYQKNDGFVLNEHQLTFVGEDGDPFLFSAGIQSMYCDFRTALDMVDEVILKWPRSNPKSALHADEKLAMA